jgi:hypothetical protein
MHQFAHLSVSLDVYAALLAAFTILVSVIFFMVGGLIARRRWNEGIGILASLILITVGANGSGAAFTSVDGQSLPSLNSAVSSILQIADYPVFILQWPVLGAFLLTFPTGRFTPRWTWILVGLWITNYLAFDLDTPPAVILFSVVVTFGSVVVVQLHRYRRAYGTLERQQTKWMLYLLAVSVVLDIAFGFLASVFGQGRGAAAPAVLAALNVISADVAFLLIILGIGIALLRYRLYEIDVIINLTLVYGSATISLGALYVGGVIALQALFGRLTGQSSDVAIAIATLMFAAVFTPWRRQLQTFIDRRFYRRKYDTVKILDSLGSRLRNEVDLELLTQDILSVTDETLQPASLSLWLRRSH